MCTNSRPTGLFDESHSRNGAHGFGRQETELRFDPPNEARTALNHHLSLQLNIVMNVSSCRRLHLVLYILL